MKAYVRTRLKKAASEEKESLNSKMDACWYEENKDEESKDTGGAIVFTLRRVDINKICF